MLLLGITRTFLTIAAASPLHRKDFMSTITVNIPVQVKAPRGATLAAALFSKFLIWMASTAESKAQRRLQAQRVAEANQVRHYAQAVMAQDRRFAADLLAAADRHELS